MQTENGFTVENLTELVLSSSGTVSTPVQMCAAGIAASNLQVLGGGILAQFTTATAHGFFNGQVVNIVGATDAGFNGYVRITVVSATVFTYQLVGTPAVTTDVGGATAATLKVRKALIYALATNTAPVTWGPNANATARTLQPGQEYELTGGPRSASGLNSSFDLATFWFQSTAASQNISIMYIPA